MDEAPKRYSDEQIKKFITDGLTGARPHSGYEQPEAHHESHAPRSAQDFIRRQAEERAANRSGGRE